MCLDGVFGNEKLRGDLAIAEAAGDQGEDFELACRDAEGLLVGVLGAKGSARKQKGRGVDALALSLCERALFRFVSAAVLNSHQRRMFPSSLRSCGGLRYAERSS